MCPAACSNSKVCTTRSGGVISRYSPLNQNSWPSSARFAKRHLPPTRTSILSTTVEYLRGPHHLGMSSGSIIVLNRSSRGASKTRVSSISRSEGNVSVIVLSLAITVFLLLLHPMKDFIQSLEALLPEPAVALDPLVGLPERCGIEARRPPLRVAAALDEPRSLEHLQMLRDGRKANVERLCELADGGLAFREAREDRPPRGIREGAEGQAERVCGLGHRFIQPNGLIQRADAHVKPVDGVSRRSAGRAAAMAS